MSSGFFSELSEIVGELGEAARLVLELDATPCPEGMEESYERMRQIGMTRLGRAHARYAKLTTLRPLLKDA